MRRSNALSTPCPVFADTRADDASPILMALDSCSASVTSAFGRSTTVASVKRDQLSQGTSVQHVSNIGCTPRGARFETQRLHPCSYLLRTPNSLRSTPKFNEDTNQGRDAFKNTVISHFCCRVSQNSGERILFRPAYIHSTTGTHRHRWECVGWKRRQGSVVSPGCCWRTLTTSRPTDFVADEHQAVKETAVGIRRVLKLTKPHFLSVLEAGPTRHIVHQQRSRSPLVVPVHERMHVFRKSERGRHSLDVRYLRTAPENCP